MEMLRTPAMRRLLRPAWMGTLRRVRPISDRWGRDRGTPVDRYYIEHFLGGNRADIHGCVLEVKDRSYTARFGSGVRKSDVLDIDAGNTNATIVTDLTAADSIPSDSIDCFILVQTLQYIYNLDAALAHSHRILRRGGTLLVTVPSVSRVHTQNDCWRFTTNSCSTLFREYFGDNVKVQSYGNVLAAMAFLTGMAQEELRPSELDYRDPDFPVIIAARAVKP